MTKIEPDALGRLDPGRVRKRDLELLESYLIYYDHGFVQMRRGPSRGHRHL